MANTDAALVVADRTIDIATGVCREHGAPGAELQAVVTTGEESLTRFAGSAIHQNVTDAVQAVRLTVTVGGRTASVSGTQLGDDDLRRLADAGLEAATVRPADPEWPGLAPPEPLRAEAGTRAVTAAGSPSADERAEAVRAFVEAADGLQTAGFCSSAAIVRAYRNSAGQRVAAALSSATIDGIARAPLGGRFADGSGRGSGLRLADLDAHGAGARAARIARAAAKDAADIEPGSWPVVLQPGAVSDVLALLSFYGYSGRAVAEGRSFVQLGEQQLDPAVTLVCDPADPLIPVMPFDEEGTPARTFDLVRAGISTGVAYDRRGARVAGTASTGSSLASDFFGGGVASSLRLEPGTASADELIGGVERGLLVTDFWYTRVLDPRTLVLTGLTRNGLFVIEDGAVVRPAPNIRFTQSYAEALAPGAVRGIAADPELMLDSPFGVLAPTVSLAAWNVTGNSAG